MPWKEFGNRRYFYSSRWIDGRARSVYRGTGEAGLSAEREDVEARARRAAERAWLESARTMADEIAAEALTLTARGLIPHGYVRDRYGRWRRNQAMAARITDGGRIEVPAPDPGPLARLTTGFALSVLG